MSLFNTSSWASDHLVCRPIVAHVERHENYLELRNNHRVVRRPRTLAPRSGILLPNHLTCSKLNSLERRPLARFVGLDTVGWTKRKMNQPLDDALEVIVGTHLARRGLRLAVAESCTGGLVGHRITNVPGSSDYYEGSVTAYSNDVKESILHVRRETLCQYGAVSEQAAREMASGVRRAMRADLGLAITGIVGPTGGSSDKPVGTVYIALAAIDGEWAEEHFWCGNRWENKAKSADSALDLLRRYLARCSRLSAQGDSEGSAASDVM